MVSATVTERGPFYRVWVTTTRSTDPATGTISEQNHSYTELANGMHYWQGNQWMESKDLIELTGTGAAAVQGPTKVAFSPSAAAPIVVDLTTASGLKLQGRVTSLHYFDAASGQEATIATIKDSTGVLYPPNQVVYLIRSTDSGSTWSSRVLVNDDNSQKTQFMPRLAVDPASTNGNVAIAWYDCRNDLLNNVKTQCYTAVSRNGGTSVCTNFRLNPGTSDATTLTYASSFDYGDYTAIDYYKGFFFFVWGDDSNNPASNPNGTSAMDLYVSKLAY